MSLGNRLLGSILDPRKTMAAVAAKPKALDALAVVLVVIAVLALVAAPYGQRDQLKAMKDNPKMKERLGEERYEAMVWDLENPSPARRFLFPFIGAPLVQLLGFLIAAVVLLILGRLVSTEGTFQAVFAVLITANAIDKILGGAVRTLLYVLRGSVAEASTSLALLVPGAALTSPATIILGQFDFFQLWMYAVIGLGLAFVLKVPAKKGWALAYGFWAAKSVVFVAFGFLARSFIV